MKINEKWGRNINETNFNLLLLGKNELILLVQ